MDDGEQESVQRDNSQSLPSHVGQWQDVGVGHPEGRGAVVGRAEGPAEQVERAGAPAGGLGDVKGVRRPQELESSRFPQLLRYLLRLIADYQFPLYCQHLDWNCPRDAVLCEVCSSGVYEYHEVVTEFWRRFLIVVAVDMKNTTGSIPLWSFYDSLFHLHVEKYEIGTCQGAYPVEAVIVVFIADVLLESQTVRWKDHLNGEEIKDWKKASFVKKRGHAPRKGRVLRL